MRVEIKVNQDIKSTKEDIWELVGPFEKIADWFKGIAETKIVKSQNTIRELTLDNKAVLWDELLDSGDFYYTYKIVKGDLPFENYVATIGVKENGNDTILYYKASIDVTTKNKNDSVAFLESIYSDAFKNVKCLVEKC